MTAGFPPEAGGRPPPVGTGPVTKPPGAAGEPADDNAAGPGSGDGSLAGGDEIGPVGPDVVSTPAEQADQRPGTWARLRAAAGGPFALPIFLSLVILIYAVPSERSFGIEAVTGGAVVRHTGAEAGRWVLPRATLCLRNRGVPRPAEASRPDPACDISTYWTVQILDADFFWPAGTQTIVRQMANGGLSVDIQALGNVPPDVGGIRLTPNSRLLVPPSAWRSHAALPVVGDLTLGLLPSGGEEGYVRGGRYLVRERPRLRSQPVTVVEGDLFPGDQVQFEGWTRGRRLLLGQTPDHVQRAMGFIAPSAASGAFTVVAYTEVGWSRMRIDRIAAEPSFVEVGWTSRALRDPILLALTAIVGLFVLLPTPRLARRRARKRF